jgi:hypothetical protein
LTEEREPETKPGRAWPGVFTINGDVAFLGVVGLIAAGWLWVLLHDIGRIRGPVESPAWLSLFNADGPVVWLQWFTLVAAVVLTGFLAGRLAGDAASFFLLLAFGVALIYLESASDLRFMLYLEYTSQMFGREIAGVSTRLLTDLVYSTLIMLPAIYAVARYWRIVEPSRAALTYLAAAVVFYGNVVLLSLFRHVDGYTLELGRAIDERFFFSRWPTPIVIPDLNQHRFIVEALLKESLEAIAAASLLAMALAFAAWVRTNPDAGLAAEWTEDEAGDGSVSIWSRIRPEMVVLGVGGFVALAWICVVIFDIVQVLGVPERPLWEQLFHNNRPAEWLQWALLLTSVVLAARLSARLGGEPARFFLLMAFGLGLVFLEETSDLRHVLYHDYWFDRFGHTLLGIPTRVVSDTIYFSLIASVPVYAVLRYARSIWDSYATGSYLIAGVVLYGIAGGLSAIRHLNDLYINLGRLIDQWFFFSRWPSAEHISQERAWFYVMDSFIEESIELMAIACLLAMILSYASYADTRPARRAAPSTPDGPGDNQTG